MKKVLFIFLLISIIISSVNCPLKAQGSILPEVSEVYLAKLIETAKSHYPRVKSFQNKISIAENSISSARASFFDEFAFSYVYQPHSAVVTPTNASAAASAALGTSSASLGTQSYSYFNGLQLAFFFNVGNFFQKPYNLKTAKENLYVARNDQAEYFLTLASEVKKRYYIYLARVAELKIQVQGSQDAEQLLNIVKHRFDKGEDTYESYNKAQTAFNDRTLSRVTSEVNLFSARTDLEELLGEKLENIK